MASGAHASGDALVDGAKLCTQNFPGQEQKNNIPTHLLAAISTTESGRWHSGLGMSVPWPWTINVDGKGYYFDSKAEAIAQTQKFQAQGHQSIDVGCMQVNLKHHAKAFANLNEAFDPAANVAYAAKFLHDNYADLGDWIKATAAYHSRTQVYGQRYLVEIERSWNKIVSKVASARAHTAGGGETTVANHVVTIPASATANDTRRMRPIADTRNVKVIKVQDTAERRGSDVLVIHPAAQPEPVMAAPIKVADATPVTPVNDVVIQPSGDSVRRVSLDSSPHGAVPVAARSQPNFVFAN